MHSTSQYQLGYAPTFTGLDYNGNPQYAAHVLFDWVTNDSNTYHEVFFKVGNGTELEALVSQHLTVGVGVGNDTLVAEPIYGAISSFKIEKVFQMVDANAFGITNVVYNNDGIPQEDIPGWASVLHNIYQWSEEADFNAVAAIAAYGPVHEFVTLTETQQGTTINYLAPPGSAVDPVSGAVTVGSASNGTVLYNDNTSQPGMYGASPITVGSSTTHITPLIDDAIALDITQTDIYISQVASTFNNIQTVTGVPYVIDLLYSGVVTYGSTLGGAAVVSPTGGNFTEQTVSDFYSAPTNVLRATFIGDSNVPQIEIYLNEIGINITDIYMADISATYSGGIATHWGPSRTPGFNIFSLPEAYADINDGIVFTSSATNGIIASQTIPSPGVPATANGYVLEFEISNYVSGELTVELTSALLPILTGFLYTHIAADGVYSIEANVDASTSSNNVKLNNMIVGSTVVFPSTPPVPNTIVFTPTSGGGFIGSLDNISLILTL